MAIIKITEDHIEQGEPFDYRRCAAALAVNECLSLAESGCEAHVDQQWIHIVSDGAVRSRMRTPMPLAVFIARNDLQPGSMKPFEVQLDIEDAETLDHARVREVDTLNVPEDGR